LSKLLIDLSQNTNEILFMDYKAKIIIVDDHALFREGMKLLIEKEGMGEVIAEAENGRVFLDLLENHKPD